MSGRGTVVWIRAALAAVAIGCCVGPLAVATPAAADRPRKTWYHEMMAVAQAHRASKGDGVVVAVIDSGVDASHPDLRGQVLDGTVIGADEEASRLDPHDDTDGHGTAMASLIAGKGTDDGVLGVAPGARILPVRLAQFNNGGFAMKSVYEAVRWAIDHGAKVVNLSLGGPPRLSDKERAEVMRYALEHDVVLVAAAGNIDNGDQQVVEPAAIPGVVAVSGVTRGKKFWNGSVQGPEVVVAAPARDVLVAVPTRVHRTGYADVSGTSAATALVSGVAALIRAKYPNMSAGNVVNRLIRTAEDLGPDGRDKRYGFGLVNAHRAVTADVPHHTSYPLTLPPGVTPPVYPEPAPTQAADAPGSPAGPIALVATVVLVGAGGAAVMLVVVLARGLRRRTVMSSPLPGVPGPHRRPPAPAPVPVAAPRSVPVSVGASALVEPEPPTVLLSMPAPARRYRRPDDRSRPAKPLYPDTPLKPVCPGPTLRSPADPV